MNTKTKIFLNIANIKKKVNLIHIYRDYSTSTLKQGQPIKFTLKNKPKKLYKILYKKNLGYLIFTRTYKTRFDNSSRRYFLNSTVPITKKFYPKNIKILGYLNIDIKNKKILAVAKNIF